MMLMRQILGRVLVFAKWPAPGAAKTRLAGALGAEGAADLARAFLLDVAVTVDGLPAERVLAYAPRGSREGFRRLLGRGWRLRLQRGDDLGERLAAALAALDSRPTVIIGTDSPWLTAAHLHGAFAALRLADVALGPCRDGGYYLIAVREPAAARGLFRGVRWSTEHALADQAAAARREGLTWDLLPEGYDVDTPDDLARLAHELKALPPEAMAHTREALRAAYR